MKIVFAGTPEFAVPSLKQLVEAGYSVCAVYTKPDRPSGRGQKLTQTPVKVFAKTHGIPVYQPETLRSQEAQKVLADLEPDVMVVAAYGLILPEAVLNIPKWGCINVHASLLPRWRGASPIQRAILAGDEVTGITIMQMDIGLDTGDILYQATCAIEKEDTSQTLHDRLAGLGGDALIHALKQLSLGSLKPMAQNESEVTYAHKISKEEGKIDWHQTAIELERKIHSFIPWPIAYTHFKDTMIRIWQAEVLNESAFEAEPGTILQVTKNGIDVATGGYILRLIKVQLPGGKPLLIQDILNGKQVQFQTGMRFT